MLLHEHPGKAEDFTDAMGKKVTCPLPNISAGIARCVVMYALASADMERCPTTTL